MKQIKQQNGDLGQTGTFLHTLLTPDEKDKSHATSDSQAQRQVNGRTKISKIDPIVRFSDPPAPPPQQPLPEKPDARSSPSDSIGHGFLKRSETERPRGSASNSPTNPQSSQILSLVEALSTAKKELDFQGARVKQLEDLLLQERTARENAEERARQLESSEKADVTLSGSSSAESDHLALPSSDEQSENTPINASQLPFPAANGQQEEVPEKEVQSRLDLMVAEMQEMKQHMEQYRQRAEKAEADASSTRASLAALIERFRQENAEAAAAAELAVASGSGDSSESSKDMATAISNTASVTSKITGSPSSSSALSAESRGAAQPGSALVRSQRQSKLNANIHQALVSLLQDNDGNPLSNSDLMYSSAPYASMLGVVLIGVGLMAYLNSWQGGEK